MRSPGEQAHEVVLGREVEARLAGVALAAGAAAQLVVDAARLVALGAEDEQPAELLHLLVVRLDLLLDPREDLLVGLVVGLVAGLDAELAQLDRASGARRCRRA